MLVGTSIPGAPMRPSGSERQGDKEQGLDRGEEPSWANEESIVDDEELQGDDHDNRGARVPEVEVAGVKDLQVLRHARCARR